VHAVHAPPFAPVYPALHVHAEAALLWSGESALASHVLSVPPEHHVPATQAVQGPEEVPVYPPLQVHADTAWLWAAEEAKSGQLVQVADVVAASTSEYVFAGHGRQAPLPDPSL